MLSADTQAQATQTMNGQDTSGDNTMAPHGAATLQPDFQADPALFQSLLETPQALGAAALAPTLESSLQAQGQGMPSVDRAPGAVSPASQSSSASVSVPEQSILMAERSALANLGARLAAKLREAASNENSLVFSLNGTGNESILVSAHQDHHNRWQIALAVESHSLQQNLEQTRTHLAGELARELDANVELLIAHHQEAP